MPPLGFKQPVSVLVVIHTPDLQILLLERAGHPGYWQSVTGSREGDEALDATACREVQEETGIPAHRYPLTNWHRTNRYEIFQEWRHRYAPGVSHNTEHVFSLEVPAPLAITLSPSEHLAYRWLPWPEAADQCFSLSNRQAIAELAGQRAPPLQRTP